MSKPTFYFTSPVSHTPMADLKAMSIMQSVLHTLEVPTQTHFISKADFDSRYGLGDLTLPLGFHIGVPETDNSFHDLESFFNYLVQQRLWEV